MLFTLSSWLVTSLAILFVGVCLIMMLVILIQKPRGGGLSGAFGGAGGAAQTAFGAKTGDVLTWFTVGCFVCFLLLAMGLTWAISGTGAAPADGSANPPAQQTPSPPGAPATPEAPAPETPVPTQPAAPAPAAPPATQPGR